LGEQFAGDFGISDNLYKLLGEEPNKQRKTAKEFKEENQQDFKLVSIDEDE